MLIIRFINPSPFLGIKKGQSRLQGNITFPDINIVFFQCGMIEKIIHSASLEDSVSRLARNSVIILHFHKTILSLSSSDCHRVNLLSNLKIFSIILIACNTWHNLA